MAAFTTVTKIHVLLACFLSLAASNSDEITSLPGLQTRLYFKQYSGYLNATGGKLLHYWFVESESNPSTDPLFLWLNGGPGCSSLFGHLGEHGPLHVHTDGRTLFLNPNRWNKYVNILYLEAPAGVGFSYSADQNYTTNDDIVAEDNYAALQDFFIKFPQFRTNDFYVSGESYGGIYVPTLSVKVLTGPAHINFKGFVIGNGYLSALDNQASLIFFGYYHGLIGDGIWSKLSEYCCNNNVSRFSCNFDQSTGKCYDAVSETYHFISGLNINVYNLYAPCVQTAVSRYSRYSTDSKLMRNLHRNTIAISETVPCVNDSRITDYLNIPQTRRALHIPDQVQAWDECSDAVAGNYQRIYNTMKPQFLQLVSSGRVRGLVYNGDVDMACNFMGDQWFVDDLNLEIYSPWKEWRYSDQVAGFYKRFKGLTFATVKGSGHMVPQDKPREALQMLKNFLEGSF